MDDPALDRAPGGELRLPAEVREQLGLGDTEAVRALDVGVRTILLERTGGATSSALPWDRDLVLITDVRSFPLADILGLVHSAGKSGFLFFTHRDHAKSVYLHRGEVVFAASNVKFDRIGECLLRSGVITLEQLREAERRHTPPERFGKVLVERGALTPRELWHAVKDQVEEIVRSLFAYTSGMVYFWEGEVQPDNVVRLSLPTRRLVSEGIQRRDELVRFVEMLRDPTIRLAPVKGSDANLAGSEREVFEALESEPTFASVRRRAGLDPLSAARTIQLLRLVGAVKLARIRDAGDYLGEADLRNAHEDRLRECVADYVKLLSELVAPLIAVESREGVTRRLSRVVASAAERSPELLEGLRLSSAGTLDPEDLFERALRVESDHLAHLHTAMGELVAYLEFELKNHPRISEPDHFLAAVDELRAKIEESA